MTAKSDFTPEEWKQVLGSVMMAAMAVTLADPSGLIGLAKEGIASGSALVAAKSDPNANALVKEFLALGLLREITGQRRNRRFSYDPYLNLFKDPEAEAPHV